MLACSHTTHMPATTLIDPFTELVFVFGWNPQIPKGITHPPRFRRLEKIFKRHLASAEVFCQAKWTSVSKSSTCIFPGHLCCLPVRKTSTYIFPGHLYCLPVRKTSTNIFPGHLYHLTVRTTSTCIIPGQVY